MTLYSNSSYNVYYITGFKSYNLVIIYFYNSIIFKIAFLTIDKSIKLTSLS